MSGLKREGKKCENERVKNWCYDLVVRYAKNQYSKYSGLINDCIPSVRPLERKCQKLEDNAKYYGSGRNDLLSRLIGRW